MTQSEPLHPHTEALIDAFAAALKDKLLAAQVKYGYGDGWAADDWEEKCRADLLAHIEKGDPRDVAAYAAFMWHHGWSTAPTLGPAAYIRDLEAQLAAQAEALAIRDRVILLLLDLARENWGQWAYRADDGTLWDAGLSTLERLQGILGPLDLLDDKHHPVAHPALSFDYEDDEDIITVGRTLLGAQS